VADKKDMEPDYEPRILSFCCNWCSYAGADLAGVSRLQMPAHFRTIRVMCSSRVNPVYVVTALERGADGVIVTGCHPGDCHYARGNYFTRRRQALLEKVLDEIGFDKERVMLRWISASEGPEFAKTMEEFDTKIKSLGRNPLSAEVFL
jgi:F420-non-reducing hydrogenase iron-sulfur subunit